MNHELKTDAEHFGPVAMNEKRVELRNDDRGFAVGDTLRLREVKRNEGGELLYTGKHCSRIVTHILRGPCYGLAEGWVMLSIRPLHRHEKAAAE